MNNDIQEINFYKRPDEVIKKPLGKVNINWETFSNSYAERHPEEAEGRC